MRRPEVKDLSTGGYFDTPIIKKYILNTILLMVLSTSCVVIETVSSKVDDTPTMYQTSAVLLGYMFHPLVNKADWSQLVLVRLDV